MKVLALILLSLVMNFSRPREAEWGTHRGEPYCIAPDWATDSMCYWCIEDKMTLVGFILLENGKYYILVFESIAPCNR